MNILLINHYAGSPEMGMAFRPYYLAREWMKMGHNVKIIAADFSHLRQKNPIVQKDFQRELIDGIPYYWIKTGDYCGNGRKRAFTMFRFVGKLWLAATKIAEQWKPGVVIASSTYPLDTYAAQRVAKLSGAKLIHEVHDMWPSTLYEMGGMSKHHPFVILMQFAENSAYKHSYKVVSLPSLAKEYMIKHGMRADKFVLTRNGITQEEWVQGVQLQNSHKDILQKIKQENKFVVGYFGGHALSNALDQLLDVAKKILDNDIVFVLVGNGVEKNRLIKRKENEGIDNVIFLNAVSKKSVPALIEFFDCCYIGANDSLLYRFGISPNKMFDSMMASKPILMAIKTPDRIIEEVKCGVMAESITEIIEAIYYLKNLTLEERTKLGKNGKQFILENCTYDKLARDLEKLF